MAHTVKKKNSNALYFMTNKRHEIYFFRFLYQKSLMLLKTSLSRSALEEGEVTRFNNTNNKNKRTYPVQSLANCITMESIPSISYNNNNNLLGPWCERQKQEAGAKWPFFLYGGNSKYWPNHKATRISIVHFMVTVLQKTQKN